MKVEFEKVKKLGMVNEPGSDIVRVNASPSGSEIAGRVKVRVEPTVTIIEVDGMLLEKAGGLLLKATKKT